MGDSDPDIGGWEPTVDKGGQTSSSGAGGGGGGEQDGLPPGQRGPAPFLLKTYNIVDDPETNDIISWNRTGSSFIIWKQEDFCQKVLPTAFKHSNQSSFVRQLNIYGFKKVTSQRQEFAHHFFLRDDKSKLHLISRTGQCGQSEAVHQVRNENLWLKQQLQQCMALYELVVQQVEAWGIPRDALSQRLGVHLPHSDPKLPVQLLLGKPVLSGENPLLQAGGQSPAVGAKNGGVVGSPTANINSTASPEVDPTKGKEPALWKVDEGTGTGPASASSLARLSKMVTQQQSSQSMLPTASVPLQVDLSMLPDQRAQLHAHATLLAAQQQQVDAATLAAQTQLIQAILSQSNRQQTIAAQRQSLQAAGMGLDLSLQPPSLRNPHAETGRKREWEGGEGMGRRTAVRALQQSEGSAFSRPVSLAQGRPVGIEHPTGGLSAILTQLHAASSRGGHTKAEAVGEGAMAVPPVSDNGTKGGAGADSTTRVLGKEMNVGTTARGSKEDKCENRQGADDRDSEKGSVMLFGVKLNQ